MAKRKRRSHKRSRAKSASMVSVAAACAAIKSLGRKTSRNPLRHFPPLKGRGRPPKTRKWDMVTRLVGGAVAETSFRATQAEAYAKARRVARKKWNGKHVAEVILDDGR